MSERVSARACSPQPSTSSLRTSSPERYCRSHLQAQGCSLEAQGSSLEAQGYMGRHRVAAWGAWGSRYCRSHLEAQGCSLHVQGCSLGY